MSFLNSRKIFPQFRDLGIALHAHSNGFFEDFARPVGFGLELEDDFVALGDFEGAGAEDGRGVSERGRLEIQKAGRCLWQT
jgi:hypothetical protein